MARTLQVLAAIAVLAIAGCIAHGDPSKPIPVATIAAKQTATRLIVVLPGRADSLAALRASGMAEAIQTAWPDADVTYAEVTLDFYKAGEATKRLHEEVIAPARARGYREIWLAGASLGGMGTLMYDAQYPRELDGMVLLAPYLGDDALLAEIQSAGGVMRWEGGASQGFTAQTWQRDLWRYLKALSNDPDSSKRIWLAYGDDDRMRKAMPLLIPVLHQQQVLVRDGGHAWTVWTPATQDILQAVDARSRATSALAE